MYAFVDLIRLRWLMTWFVPGSAPLPFLLLRIGLMCTFDLTVRVSCSSCSSVTFDLERFNGLALIEDSGPADALLK